LFDRWLQAIGKLDYTRKNSRPKVDCILCAVRDNDNEVKSFKIYQDDIAFSCLNLYPYNPGHLLVVPNRHIKSFRDLNKEEIIHISRLIQGLQLLIKNLFENTGFNIGINEGPNSGASIEHFHYHIVPRYANELGFIDIVSNSRIAIEGLESVLKRYKEKIKDYINENFFKNF
jgi:ATP adenylyltransferase